MEENIPRYFCESCGKEITTEDTNCPGCGAALKEVRRKIKLRFPPDKIHPSDSLGRIRQKRKGILGYLLEIRWRKKKSGKTKRPAREQLVIDRTSDKETVKKHRVEEHNGQRWIKVHNEKKVFRARRRKKNHE